LVKIVLGTIDPRALTSSLGSIVVRDTKHGPVVASKGYPRKSTETEAQREHRKRFAFAAIMAASPTSTEFQTAKHLSEGTEQVPRDLLTMAALGTFYEFYWPDGTQLERNPGAINFVRPELESSVWEWSQWDAAWTATMDTFAAATKGVIFTPPFNDRIYSVRVVFTVVNGATYRLGVGTANAGNVIQTLVNSSPQIGVGAGLQCLQFDLDTTFLSANKNFIILTRTDLLSNYILPININQVKRWLYPLVNNGTCRVVSNNPIVGSTLTIVAAGNASPFAFRINQ